MGYFSLPQGTTRKDYVEAIRANAELYLRHPDSDYDYLVTTFIANLVEKFRAADK